MNGAALHAQETTVMSVRMVTTRRTVVALVILMFQLMANPRTTEARCLDQTSCPPVDPAFYTVHIVPHSHMDLGWLKTGMCF